MNGPFAQWPQIIVILMKWPRILWLFTDQCTVNIGVVLLHRTYCCISISNVKFSFCVKLHYSVCYNKNTNRCDFLYYVFISFFSSFPYVFRAFMGPSSGVFQAVVFMLPFGSCSALLIVCVRQRTGLWS